MYVSKNYIPGDRCCLNFCIWLIQAQFWKQIFLNLQIFCYFSSVCHCSHPIDPMQGVIWYIWAQRIFSSQKQWRHYHPLFKVLIVKWKTSEGDEITWRSPNFVTLQKNEFSRPRKCPRPKWLWATPRPLRHRFQYRKKSWGALKKIRRKKMFSPKSMTKLEALTV